MNDRDHCSLVVKGCALIPEVKLPIHTVPSINHTVYPFTLLLITIDIINFLILISSVNPMRNYYKTIGMFVLTVCTFLSSNCRIVNSSFESFSGETIVLKWASVLDDSISIISNNNHTIYRLPSYHTVSTTNLSKNLDVLSEDSETKLIFSYFLHKKNEISGFKYDSINATSYSQKLSVDSVLIKHAFKDQRLDCLDNKKKIATVKEGDYIKETYVPVVKNITSADTTYLYFSKNLKDLKYSFSSILDQARDSKLFRIEHVRNPEKSKQGEILIPGTKYLFELKRMNIDNRKLLKGLIKRNSLITDSMSQSK